MCVYTHISLCNAAVIIVADTGMLLFTVPCTSHATSQKCLGHASAAWQRSA